MAPQTANELIVLHAIRKYIQSRDTTIYVH